jgi:5-methyltetrahydrofolate--homocysteine methyltransferase
MEKSSLLFDAILNGDLKTALAATQAALAEGTDATLLLSEHLIPAMDEVGRRFESEEFFVPELLLASRAMKSSLALIQPLLAGSCAEPAGRVVIGTVRGDLHDIGKNLVVSMLVGAGFEVHDLGVDVPPKKFIEAVHTWQPGIVGISALLTVTLSAMKSTVQALRDAGVRDGVRIMVGGAPVTRQYAEEIGADGYSENAFSAVALARQLAPGNHHD